MVGVILLKFIACAKNSRSIKKIKYYSSILILCKLCESFNFPPPKSALLINKLKFDIVYKMVPEPLSFWYPILKCSFYMTTKKAHFIECSFRQSLSFQKCSILPLGKNVSALGSVINHKQENQICPLVPARGSVQIEWIKKNFVPPCLFTETERFFLAETRCPINHSTISISVGFDFPRIPRIDSRLIKNINCGNEFGNFEYLLYYFFLSILYVKTLL